ncbi:MAG: hypothetical protein FWD60_04630 [Candidatus Azobacteroides sp.]|nr:hypothetical protein [Candidatus Azobacteroides sp.]
MKVIKELTVEVTYTVSLSDVGVSDKVYNEIADAYDSHNTIDCINWIRHNINEYESMTWDYKILNFE